VRREPPQPLDIDWVCKSVSSVRTRLEVLADGRLHCHIEHEVVRGVTPAMLAAPVILFRRSLR